MERPYFEQHVSDPPSFFLRALLPHHSLLLCLSFFQPMDSGLEVLPWPLLRGEPWRRWFITLRLHLFTSTDFLLWAARYEIKL